MSNFKSRKSQGMLFSEPSYSDTGVWCQLNQEIDPAEWARVCRYIGQMAAEEFEELSVVLKVSQQPIIELQERMNEALAKRALQQP